MKKNTFWFKIQKDLNEKEGFCSELQLLFMQ